ncbi:DUF1382 family protein [Uliginosibacterium gangwonense]|uniref:DUF1382 family protein n=1 Tax=Uliginosibacterium gangwonense TaxID=392736 RepID=UPI00036523A0|nr:DUF1382 family protein [Uliginosibacterium gangwonense]
MNRATPIEMRKALEAVEIMKRAGLRFVPMPVLNEQDHQALAAQVQERLNTILAEVEG